jgi:peroxiredoxin
MESLYEDMKARGEPFEILSVSIDSVGPEVIENFCREFKLTFPILHDRKGKIKKVYKTTGVPESFILDQNGFVAQKVIGAYNWASPSGRRVIEALLKEGPQSAESLQEEETVDAR